MKPYLLIFGLGLVGAAVVSALPHPSAAPPAPAGAVTRRALAVDIDGCGAMTSPAALPAGSTVTLTVTNHRPRSLRVSLAGYEDRVASPPLAPNASWHVTFVADRPGEQFAWLVNGRPEGRLDLTGSHLVEGHE